MTPKSLTPVLRYGASLGVRGLEIGAKFGLYALAARVLGGQGSGIFFLWLTVLHLATTLARLGLERPVARNVAAYLASGQTEEAAGTARRAVLLTLATGLFVGAAAGLAADWQASLYQQPAAASALRLLAVAIPGQVLALTLGYVLIALERGVLGQLLMNTVAPLATFAALVLGQDDLGAVLVVYSGAYWFSAVAALALAWSGWPRGAASAASRSDLLPGLLRSSRQFLVIELLQASLIAAPVVVLARFADAPAVSQFSLANRLSMLVSAVIMSLGAIAAPSLAQRHRLNDAAGLGRAVRQFTCVGVCLCAPLITVMILFREPLLTLMGAEGQAASTALLIMALGQAAIAIFPGRDTLLAMAGQGDGLRTLGLIQGVVLAVGCATLIPSLGVVGAALASALAWGFAGLGAEFLARRRVPQAFGRPASPAA